MTLLLGLLFLYRFSFAEEKPILENPFVYIENDSSRANPVLDLKNTKNSNSGYGYLGIERFSEEILQSSIVSVFFNDDIPDNYKKENLEIVFKYLNKNCILHNKLNFMSRNSNAELGNLIEDSCLLPEAIASYKRYENIFNEQSKLDMMATLQLHRDWSLLGVQAGLWTIDPFAIEENENGEEFLLGYLLSYHAVLNSIDSFSKLMTNYWNKSVRSEVYLRTIPLLYKQTIDVSPIVNIYQMFNLTLCPDGSQTCLSQKLKLARFLLDFVQETKNVFNEAENYLHMIPEEPLEIMAAHAYESYLGALNLSETYMGRVRVRDILIYLNGQQVSDENALSMVMGIKAEISRLSERTIFNFEDRRIRELAYIVVKLAHLKKIRENIVYIQSQSAPEVEFSNGDRFFKKDLSTLMANEFNNETSKLYKKLLYLIKKRGEKLL